MEWQNSEVASPAVETPVWTSFDHGIDVPEAQELITRYREQHPGSRTAGLFTRVPLDAILAQQGCVGVRVYFALNPDGTQCLVMVGVDAEKNDLEGVIAERSFPCPPECGLDSILDW